MVYQSLPAGAGVNMRVLPVVILVIAFAKGLSAAPAAVVARAETDPELTAGYFQGDMILDQRERNGMIDESYRWPNRVVYYFINSYIGKI